MDHVFSIDAISAGKGDCLLLHWGNPEQPSLMLIDGGVGRTYHHGLGTRIGQLRQLLAIAADKPLPLEFVIVSHLDADHMDGVLKMVEAEHKRSSPSETYVQIRALWSNTFDDVLGVIATDKPGLAELASVGGDGHCGLDVLTSLPAGRKLREAAKALSMKTDGDPRLNPPYGEDHQVMAAHDPVDLSLGPLQITVLGPSQQQIIDLKVKWDAFLRSKGLGVEAAKDLDRSVTNLASIVTYINCDGRSMLLTGDARGDYIIRGMEDAGLLTPDKPAFVDILKIPHHGSQSSTTVELINRIQARHYIFSGDGSHGNPDRVTLERVLAARGDATIDLHFTYSAEFIDEKRREHFRRYKYNWSDTGNALTHWMAQVREKHPNISLHFGQDDRPIHVAIGAVPYWPGER